MEPGSQSGYAPALNHCPHVEAHVTVKAVPEVKSKLTDACENCGHSGENWVCLSCYKVFCGRFVNKHMKQHNTDTGHLIAMGVSDLSFWCYSCDSYLNHQTIPAIATMYSIFHQLKFHVAPPSESMQGVAHEHEEEEEEEEHGEEEDDDDDAQVFFKPKPAFQPPTDPNAWLVDGLDEKLLDNPVVDKILGCIYGNALGDAVGLATEFMDKKEVNMLYPNGMPVPFPGYKQSFHSVRWDMGDWTDDTDQMILIMDTITETKGHVDEKLFAKKLRDWIDRGFPELGDMGGMGLGMTVASVVRQSKFLVDPHECSKKIWLHGNKNVAANGAVMRTSILGCFDYKDIDKVIANTTNIAQVTHWDPRCVASCVAVTTAIAYMLQGHPAETKEDIKAISDLAEAHALKCDLGEHKDAFLQHMYAEQVEDLKLDESRAIGYTLKCFGSGFFAFRSQTDFKSTINTIIREAGDADTNGAVAGAMIGCRLGFKQLPRDWLVAMPNKKWLDKRVMAFLKLMQLA